MIAKSTGLLKQLRAKKKDLEARERANDLCVPLLLHVLSPLVEVCRRAVSHPIVHTRVHAPSY
jgi:hypothetical protein